MTNFNSINTASISPIGAYNPTNRRPPAYPLPSTPGNYMPAPDAYMPLPMPLPPAPYQAPMAPAPYLGSPYPQAPYQPSYPQYPTTRPNYPGYPAAPGTSFAGDMWHGFTDRLQEVGQIVLHPLNAQARTMPYRNPFAPRTGGEELGRWVVNGALIAGAFFLGRGLLGGSLFAGGGARVGMATSPLWQVGNAIGGVFRFGASVVTAPFRFIGSLFRGAGAMVGYR
jgi:hypothetical protein